MTDAAGTAVRPFDLEARLAGAASLLEHLDQGAADILARILDDPDPTFRGRIVKLVSRIRVAEGRAVILRALEDRDPFVRKSALEAATARHDIPLDLIEAHLKDEEASVRLSAVRALVALQSEASGKALLGALADPLWSIRREAVAGLGRTGSGSEHAMRVLACDPDSEVRRAALLHLAACLDKAVLTRALVQALKDRDTGLLLEALDRAWDAPDEELRAAVAGLLNHPSPMVTRRARRVLAPAPGTEAGTSVGIL